MKDSTVNKLAGGTFFIIMIIILFIVALLGWGFVEVIQWLTSK